MAAGARYFCTAGRGLEPFLAREVRARLGATEVDYVLGKVFFTTAAEPGELKELKSGERLFLLLKKCVPLSVSRNKGKMLHEIKSLLTEEPKSCLDVIATWRKLRSHEGKKDEASQENRSPHKRKPEEEINIASKRQKTEQVREIASEECQAGAGENCVVSEEESDQDCQAERKASLEGPTRSSIEKPIENEKQNFSFRVSCRCSGAIAKILTSQVIQQFTITQNTLRVMRDPEMTTAVCSNLAGLEFQLSTLQEIGRAVGIALRKQFGWQADLRAPDLEIFLHLNDIHSVVGIPLFRLPLANREYIKTAGLRSTVAWAMASLAEISVGAFVLDPMCGLGTILLEAAKEWPEACYWGTDTSDSQLEGASVNIKAAGLDDKIELFKASVKALPLPSESFDAVISDIPFGKKFKITKDIQLLPDILQEMERVLRVGGIIVLLLNQDLRKRMDGIAKTVENESLNAVADGAGETTAVKALNNDGNSSSLGAGVEEPVLGCGQMRFGSLVPDGIYEVSLGKTDAFIYKYKKISTAGNK